MATVILQARMGSSRLPGKSLRLMAGRPMLWYVVDTLRAATGVDRLVLAIPAGERDDVLARLATEWGVACVRGSEADVLERYARAAAAFPDDVYLRATGDNPVLDRDNPQRTLRHLRDGQLEYACEIGMPLGAVVEAFTADALQRAQREAARPDDREHVTLYMKKSGRFRTALPSCPSERHWPELRLTVDTDADFARVERIVGALYRPAAPDFTAVLQYCRDNRLQQADPH